MVICESVGRAPVSHVKAMRVCVQDGQSCLHAPSRKGLLPVVKYLCEQGGSYLLMLTDKVSEVAVCEYICV